MLVMSICAGADPTGRQPTGDLNSVVGCYFFLPALWLPYQP